MERGGGAMTESQELKPYFDDVAGIPLLTPDEERALFRKLRSGDEAARHKIVVANQRLVIMIARQHLDRGLAYGDLIGEGNVGLMRAIDKFKLSKKCKLSTYAMHWIRQAITRAIHAKAHTVRPPVDLTAQVPKYRRTVDRLADDLGRRPSQPEIAKTLGMSHSKAGRLEKASLAISPMKPLGESGSVDTVTVRAIDEEQAWATALRETEERDMVDVLLRAVPRRYRDVIRLRYGLDGGQPLTLESVGTRLGVTRERVRQIQTQAIKKMSDALQRTGGADDENRPSPPTNGGSSQC